MPNPLMQVPSTTVGLTLGQIFSELIVGGPEQNLYIIFTQVIVLHYKLNIFNPSDSYIIHSVTKTKSFRSDNAPKIPMS